MKNLISMIVGTIGANVTGYALVILALVNFVWLLVKDETLFSWWILLYVFIAFLLCLVVVFVSVLKEWRN